MLLPVPWFLCLVKWIFLKIPSLLYLSRQSIILRKKNQFFDFFQPEHFVRRNSEKTLPDKMN